MSSDVSLAKQHAQLWQALQDTFNQALERLREVLREQGFRDLGIDFRYSATATEVNSFVYVIVMDPASGFPAAVGVTLRSAAQAGGIENGVRMHATALQAASGAPCAPVLHSEPLQTLDALPDEPLVEAMGSILEDALLRRGCPRLLEHVRH